MNTIRDNIPIDQILRQYIDETQEVDVETVENIVPIKDQSPPVENLTEEKFKNENETEENNADSSEDDKKKEPESLIHEDAVEIRKDINDPEKDIVKEPELNVSFSSTN